MSFNFHDTVCTVSLGTDSAAYQLAFGEDKWQMGETTKHGPSLVAAAKASFNGLPPLKIAAAYSLKDEHTVELILRYIESPHTEKMLCHIDGDTISIELTNSFEYGSKKTILKGTIKE